MSKFIYYDMQYTSLVADGVAPQLQFDDHRATSILDSAQDYKMSIVRFQVDTPYLPSYICLIQPGQPDVNKSIYSVKLRIGSHSSDEQFMIWEPVNMKESGEPVTGSVQRIENEYYWGYNCQYFLDLLNKQLDVATDAVIASAAGTMDNLATPYFKWEDNKVVLYTDVNYECEVFFNKALYTRFSSFNLKNWMRGDGEDYQIIVDRSPYVSTNNAGMNRTVQEYDTISNWSPVQSLMFLSDSIAMNYSYASPAVTDVNGYPIKVQGSDYNSVITDIQTNDNFYKSNLIYVPSAEYRWVSLTGGRPIRDVVIKCCWKDKFGGIHPLRMPPGCSASIKLLFQALKD